MSPTPVTIDVFSDVACPWCFVGKRRLEKAIAEQPAGSVLVRWHAYQLQPDLPPEGFEGKEYFAKKFGGAQRMEQLFRQMTQLGQAEGIAFQMDRQWAANTRLAHRLVALAAQTGEQDKAVEAFFRAHFEEGANVGDLAQALAILQKAGLDAEALRAKLAAGGGEDEVTADLQLAQELGIEGVPLFIANGRLAISGAQPVGLFTQFIERARQMPTTDAGLA